MELNYQAIGSGGGQNQIRNRTVDFGASDAPLTAEQLQQSNLLQFPTVMGVGRADREHPGRRTRPAQAHGRALGRHLRGQVTKWNDPRLAEKNPGVGLPNLAIAPAYRADGSGTTFVFTSYLSAAAPDWKQKVGAATSVRWPVGAGARGNDGVAGTVRNTRGAIGYVEYAYAHTNQLTTAQLRNKAGNFVKPTMASFQAAAGNADWSVPDFAASLIDTPGAESWPTTTSSAAPPTVRRRPRRA